MEKIDARIQDLKEKSNNKSLKPSITPYYLKEMTNTHNHINTNKVNVISWKKEQKIVYGSFYVYVIDTISN